MHLKQGGVVTTTATAIDKTDASVEVALNRLKVQITLNHSNWITLIQKEGALFAFSPCVCL